MWAVVRQLSPGWIGRLPDLCVSRFVTASGEAVLHREQCRFGAGRDAELGVDVLEVGRHGLARDRELAGDLAVRSTASQRDEDGCLACRQSARKLGPPAHALTAGTEDRIDDLAVEAAGACLLAQDGGYIRWVVRIAVGPRLPERLVDVGDGEDPCRQWDHVAAKPAGIAG